MVSVILPNYNYAKYLPKRIDSILNQTFEDFELIILDDASTDDSIEVIEQYREHPKVKKIIINKINSGSPFIQWEKGIEASNGEFIWVAEADDWSEKNFLTELVPILRENPNIGISYCHSINVNEIERTSEKWINFPLNPNDSTFMISFTMKGLEFVKKYMIHWNVIPNASSVIFRKEIYNKVKKIDLSIPRCADWHLWINMLLISEVYFSTKPLNYFRRHTESVINKEFDHNRYNDRYDSFMRSKLALKEFKKIEKINKNYIWLEQGYKGAWLIEHKHVISGWKKILKSFLLTGCNSLPVINGFRSTFKLLNK